MKTRTTDPIELKTSQTTGEVFVNCSGPISIQPVVDNLCGSPTYTLEVSNDKSNFVAYDPLSTGISLEDQIQIDYAKIPWLYMRVSVTAALGDSGTASFIFIYNG